MLPATVETSLPRPTDDALQAAVGAPWRDDLGPGGQVAFPVAGAQLGLDGRSYVGSGAEPQLRAEGPNRHLGPLHALWLPGVWDGPQLDLWDRFEGPERVRGRMTVMRGILRDTAFNRQSKCCRTRRVPQGSDVRIRRNEAGSWAPLDLVECGHMTCPKCGPKICRRVAAVLALAIRRQLNRGDLAAGDVWMLTLTPPHYRDETMACTVARLYAACAAFWRSTAWLRFARMFGLIDGGRVRVLDVTFGGKNGAHPHFHVALFPSTTDYHGASVRHDEARDEFLAHFPHDQDITGDDPDDETLAQAWARCLAEVGAVPRTPDAKRQQQERGLMFSPADKAERYFVRWGLANEVGATTAKARNHLRLLDLAGAGVPGAAATYHEWRAAVEKRAWVTGVQDLCRRFAITDDDVTAYLAELRAELEARAAAEGTPLVKVAPLALVVRPHLYAAALTLDWGEIFAFVDHLEVAGAPCLQAGLDAMLVDQLRLLRTSSERGPPTTGPPSIA